MNIEHTRIDVNGTKLHVAWAGPRDGPVAMLLHGFPEFWYGWRHQVNSLASAGYRLWIPDQRGYNLSDKPVGVNAYRLDALAGDILGLIHAAGKEQVDLIGHDWGGAVAWWLAAQQPARVRRLVVINCPHWAAFRRQLQRDPLQMLRSWYILFFQIPWLPELVFRLGNGALPAMALRQSSLLGTFSDAELAHYRLAWSRPGVWTATLNWYRALLQMPPRFPMACPIVVPTLLIWGAKDRFLGRQMAMPSIERCIDGRLVTIKDATHWVTHERAALVNQLIGAFLSGR